MTEHTRLDRLGLLLVAGACIVALTWISIRALGTDKLDPNAATLLGAIVAGLIATAGACLQAIRGYSMSAQLGKVTDQLARAGPVPAPDAPSGAPDDPVSVIPGEKP